MADDFDNTATFTDLTRQRVSGVDAIFVYTIPGRIQYSAEVPFVSHLIANRIYDNCAKVRDPA